MKIKFKFGNAKVKISYPGKLEDYNVTDNPFTAMFSKLDADYFTKMYEKTSSDTINFYENFKKVFEMYMDMNSAQLESMKDDPDILYANGHDIYNYVARYGMANYQIQAIMTLDGRLDFFKLSKAVRLTIDEEPVFGCRFVESHKPYWKRVSDIDEAMLCSFEETDNRDEAIQRFLDIPLDMDNDPMVKVKLIRSGPYDTIGIKINHSCCDGAGVKEYLKLLSDIYSCIDDEHGIYIPNPKTRSRKDQDILFSNLGIKNPESSWIPGSEITRYTWLFPWKQGQSEAAHIVTCKIPQEYLDRMTSYAKDKGVTINDLILTAYYRAMLQMGHPIYSEPMEIPVTVDLRRYLPDGKTEAIRNFSGSENTRLTMIEGESFSETLSRVAPMMKEIKNKTPGLQSAIGLERVEKMVWGETLAYYRIIPACPSFFGNKCGPVLSNLGLVTNNLFTFGKNVVTDAYIVPPVVRAPGLLLMVSTYNGVVTLSAGYYEGSLLREDMERLLNGIKDELIQGCSQYNEVKE